MKDIFDDFSKNVKDFRRMLIILAVILELAIIALAFYIGFGYQL